MPMPGIYTPAWVFAVYTPQGSDLRASRILASRNNQVEIHLCISVTLPALWTYTGCAEGPERAAPCASVLVSEGCRLAIAVGTHALLCLHRSCSNKQQHKNMYVYILYIHSCKYMHSFSSTSLCVGALSATLPRLRPRRRQNLNLELCHRCCHNP